MFARALSMASVQEVFLTYQDRQRIKTGIPDHPWSLGEGLSGEICMLADLTQEDDLTLARFPAYDAIF